MRTLFKYHRPTSAEQAIQLKVELGADAHFWAGGTDLQLEWMRGVTEVKNCIDITHLPLRSIDSDAESMRIGALTTLADLERAGSRNHEAFAISEIAKVMCTPQTRTLATIAGNIVHASPSADLAPTLLTVDATVELLGSAGVRTVPLSEFFVGVQRTVKEADELVTGFVIPVRSRRRAAHARVARTTVDIALSLAAASVTLDEADRVGAVRIALGSVAPTPVRAVSAEQSLEGVLLGDIDGDTFEQVARLAAGYAKPITDVRASKEFRVETIRVLVRRALEDSIGALRASEVLV